MRSNRFHILMCVLASLLFIMLTSMPFIYGASRVWHSIGGSMGDDLIIDPESPSTLYIRFSAGILWSPNGGTNWGGANNGLPLGNIHALAIDPQNTDVMYAGTSSGIYKSISRGGQWFPIGSGLTYNSASAIAIDPHNSSILYAVSMGDVYKSTDQGNTWSGMHDGLASDFIYGLAIDPNDPTTLYAWSFGGIYKRSNGGKIWDKTYSGRCTDVAVDPRNSTNIYAACDHIALKSTNAGTTWATSDNGLTGNVKIIVINLLNPTNIYAAGNGIYISTDGGSTWTPSSNGMPYTNIDYLAIDPRDPNILYAGGATNPTAKSTDGGASWSVMGNGLDNQYIRGIAIDPKNFGTIYAGSYKSVFKTTDRGEGWKAASGGLPQEELTALAINPEYPQILYAAFRSGVYKSTDSGENWSLTKSWLPDTVVSGLTIDARDTESIYAWTAGEGIFKSTDGGLTWDEANNGIPWAKRGIGSLEIDPTNPSIVFAGTSGGILKSVNGGASWNPVSSLELSGFSIVDSLAINPADPTNVYAGSEDAGIFRSTDGGASWSILSNGITSRDISAIAINSNNPNTVYAGTRGGGVFKSTDGGQNWLAINRGLGNRMILTIAIDPEDPDRIYALTQIGLWVYAAPLVPSSDITITANHSGLHFAVDGVVYDKAQTFAWAAGTSHEISTLERQGSGGTRYSFSSWSDGGGSSHSITVPDNDKEYVATFETEYQLSSYVAPQGFGDIRINPPSEDGYYRSGTSVQLTASAKATYSFSGWIGSLESSSNPQNLSMSAPHSVTATFLRDASVILDPQDDWSTFTVPTQIRITAMGFDPKNKDVIYAGTTYGVLRTLNGGLNWSFINSGPTKKQISSVVIDPLNSSIVYTATWGDGVYKSTNGGSDWSAVGAEYFSFSGKYISILSIDPHNPAILYVANLDGLFKSIDGGMRWSPITDGPINAFVMNPQNPAILYCASGHNLIKSTNGGANWTVLSSDVGRKSVVSLAVDPKNPGTIYAGVYGGVYQSKDSGSTWSARNNGLPGSGAFSVLVDAQDSASLYAANGSKVYRTTDGGTGWRITGEWSEESTVRLLTANPHLSNIVYVCPDTGGLFTSTDKGASWQAPDNPFAGIYIMSLAIDSQMPSFMYAGTNFGVFKSVDAGRHWEAANDGMGDRTIRSVAVSQQNPATIYAGSAKGVYISIDRGATWSFVDGGYGNYQSYTLSIDPQNPATIYAGGDSIRKSMDGGGSWTQILIGVGSILALAIDPQNPTGIYAGTESRGVMKSTNGGNTWTDSSKGLPAAQIRALAIDPQNPAVLYAGTFMGGIYKSTDGGENWFAAGTGLESISVQCLIIDPRNPHTIYAGTSEGPYRTTDGGMNWSPLSTGLTSESVTALAINPGRRVYASVEQNGIWARALPATATSEITIATVPAGLAFSTDGITYTSPRTFYWTAGSSHSLSVASPQASGQTRHIFENWSDGGAIAHSIIIPETPKTYTASFAAQYPLSTSVSPASAGSIQASPASDGYYEEGSEVEITAIANSGYSFAAWSGDLSGTTHTQTIIMTAPRSVIAEFRLFGTISFDLNPGGASTTSTQGTGPLRTRYAKVVVDSGQTPYGIAVFSFRQNGVIVSEVGVPVSPPTTSARIFIDYRPATQAVPGRNSAGSIGINTGIAIVNYGDAVANVTYTLRDSSGDSLGLGYGTIAAGSYFAGFIDQLKEIAAPDFELPLNFGSITQFGTLEIASNQPLSVLALRGTNNQRNDFLMTTTPVADLTQSLDANPIYFPQFVDGGGYTTSLILMNTSDITETGRFQIMDDDGNPFIVHQAGGNTDASFDYSISPHGIFRFQSDGAPGDTRIGWVQLNPGAGTSTPVSSGIYGFNPEDVLVSESGIPSASATTHARIYADLSNNHNTGLAVANTTDNGASIVIRAFEMDGVTAVGTGQASILLPANGHSAGFADQFVEGLPEGFTGVLDISASTPFAAITLRSMLNERHDFLMTTFPVADADRPAPSPILFPHIVNGDGYRTEFILISAGQTGSATLRIYDKEGTLSEFGE
jgi:photosystem II stability/assembly factor-like uncharacterized protein